LSILPGLLCVVGAHSGISSLRSKSRKNQSFQVGHLLLRAILFIVMNTPAVRLGIEKKTITKETIEITEFIKLSRKLCRTNKQIGAAVYELLLDVLLYQTMPLNSDLPPPGLSQIGKERLLSGNSTVAKTWAAEYASNGRLRELKLAVLDFISPNRTWDIFSCSSSTKEFQDDNQNDSINENEAICSTDEYSINLGVTRAVSLLVASCGDKHDDIVERATSYLKAHLDSLRNAKRSLNDRNTSNGKKNDTTALSSSLLGDPISLGCQLLTLVLGDLASDSVVAKVTSTKTNMATNFGVRIDKNASIDRTMTLSLKRRMVSERAATAILNFVSVRILEEIPGIFSSLIQKNADTPTDFLDRCGGASSLFGSLVLLSVKKYVGSGRSLSGTSITSNVGNPSVASARLLNSLCVRLVSLYDTISSFLNESNDDSSEIGRKNCDTLHDTLIRSLNIACSIVSVAESAHSGDVKNVIGIEARDSAYGIICTIFRSKLVLAKNHTVFSCGGDSSISIFSPTSSKISSKIATLLFGCCSNEAESLKPRSVAALDSTLSAYCRLFENSKKVTTGPPLPSTTPFNPWAKNDSYDTKEIENKIEESLEGDTFEGFSSSILPLLWNAAQSFQPKASRHASAKWANELLISLDLVNACHLLCYLTGDKDTAISYMSKDGLGIRSQIGKDEISNVREDGKEIKLPDFNDFVSTVLTHDETFDSTLKWKQSYTSFAPSGQGATLRFGMMCLLSDLYGNEEMLLQFMSILSSTLSSFRPVSGPTSTRQDKESVDLLDECAICLSECLRTSQFARMKFSDSSLPLSHEQIAELVLTSSSSRARRNLAAGCGYLLEDVSIWNCTCPDGTTGIEEWVKNSSMDKTIEICASKLESMQRDLFMVGQIHGAIYLGSRCVRAFRTLLHRENHKIISPSTKNCWDGASSILSSLGRGLDSEEVIGNACSKGLTIALSYDGPDCFPLNEQMKQCTGQALVKLASSIRKYGNGDHTDASRAYSLAEAAGTVLASSTLYTNKSSFSSNSSKTEQNSINIGSSRLECVDALFSLLGSSSYRKDPEISLVVGEAISFYADAYGPKDAVWSMPQGIRPEIFDETYANALPPHSQVVYRLLKKEAKVTNPIKRTACAPVMLALVARAARLVNTSPASSERAYVKEIYNSLQDFQTALLNLLSDPKSKQLARESCCLGLAACQGLNVVVSSQRSGYLNEIEENNLNDQLLRAFGQTSNHGKSALMESRAQNAERVRENRGENSQQTTTNTDEFGVETEIGGTAGLGEAALGAYREMASASMVLGRPDILYTLMILSVNHPTWSVSGFRDRYSASALLGTNKNSGSTEEIKTALRPHLSKLLPRMLRATHDPNPQTRDQMKALWIGLTGGGAESRAVISEHFLTTLDTLIDDAMNKLWKARVGACRALSEIIVGRDWSELGGGYQAEEDDGTLNKGSQNASTRLLRLYKLTVRSLDDVRLTVRESGEALARSVRGLSLRLCTPFASKTKDIISLQLIQTKSNFDTSSSTAAATILPWLVKYGLNQPCAEATGFSISCLLGIVEVSKPSTLQDVLPELIGALLMAMSGLEPAALNYLQVSKSNTLYCTKSHFP